MANKALEGIRVLDMGMFWAGPYCGGILADMGAEVIKVESAVRPDPLRISGRGLYPDKEPGERPWNRSGMIIERNRNKMGITLDLTHPKGKETFKRLVKISDVLIENFSRRVMPGFGLDYPVLKEVNPALIFASLASMGLTGPDRDHVSFGNTLEQIGGLMQTTGYGDRLSAFRSFAYPDALAGVFGAGCILAALRYRRLTGKGMQIDLSQRELTTSIIGEVVMDYAMNKRVPQHIGNRHPVMAPHGVYQCAGDDRWVTIAVGSDESWENLCQVIGQPQLATDIRFADAVSRWKNQDELDKIITEWTTKHDHYEAMNLLQKAGLSAAAVLDVKELYEDPQLSARGYFQPSTHPEAGTYLYRTDPIKLSRTPLTYDKPAPCLGEHNRYVYGKLLGMSDVEIKEMEQQGIIGTVPSAKDLQFT